MMAKAVKQDSQVEKFREAARELETNESEQDFNALVKKIAKAQKGSQPSQTSGNTVDKNRKV